MRCPCCNETDHRPEAIFCHMCGKKLRFEHIADDAGMLIDCIIWVDANHFDESLYKRIITDRFDLLQILNEFEDYWNSHQDIFDTSDLSLYIEEIDFKTFIIHLYDTINKKVLQTRNGFDYYISTRFLYHTNNIKGIFKHEKHNAIVCKLDRIQKLQERIQESTLTF